MFSVFAMQVRPYEGDGLSFVIQGITKNVKFDGKVRNTREIALSPDGKTLTMTIHTVGQSKPNILVFGRQ